MKRRLAVFSFAVLLAACSGAEVDVRNRSSTRLEDVVISAKGVSAAIESIGPVSEKRTVLCPRGEAGAVELSFRANGQAYRKAQPVYFECDSSYRVQVEVSARFEMTAISSLK